MQLVLRYGRDGEVYNGDVRRNEYGEVCIDEAGEVEVLRSFKGLSFESMLVLFSGFLRDYVYECDEAVFQRTESHALQPYVLAQSMADLIRTDPIKAAQCMSPSSVVVHVRGKSRVESSVKITVRAGYDTLADAFGDEVYCRTRGWHKVESTYKDKEQHYWGGELESIFDGRWKKCHVIGGKGFEHTVSVPDDLYIAPTCALVTVMYTKVSDSWAAVSVPSLLEVGARRKHGRYFLPQAWNESGPWILHEELKKKYDEYVKEKNDVSISR